MCRGAAVIALLIIHIDASRKSNKSLENENTCSFLSFYFVLFVHLKTAWQLVINMGRRVSKRAVLLNAETPIMFL